jgi:two-component system NarL family response regulator
MNSHSIPYSSISVLVVCSDPIIRAGIAATLIAVPGLSVQVDEQTSVVHSEPSAIAGIDVVIADYGSALTIARAINKNSFARPAPPTRIMILSQQDGETEIRRALECGIQGYLPLESTPEDVVEGVVSLHRGQRVLGRVVAQRVAESFAHAALTRRELDVLRLVIAGEANKVVARRLSIATGTVKVHVRSIMSKLGARTRTEAASVARRRGLVGVDPEIEMPSVSAPWSPQRRPESSLSGTSFPALRIVHRQ